MKRLEINEFKRLTNNVSDDAKCKCMHMRLVRLYTIGAKSNYGCLDCGMESSSLSSFRPPKNGDSGHNYEMLRDI